MKKITDILDVWFDSGVTHACVLADEELQFPADLYLEGSDQHRGWFQSSLLTSMAINDTPPYKGVLTHGFVVDAEGKKMSKSLGNTISPQEIWNSRGADVLRAWIASTDYRNEMVISDTRLQGVSDTYRRIRNTIRFLLGNVHDFDSASRVKENELTEIDRFMEIKTQNLQKELIEDYQNYQFHLAFNKIHNFCSNDLGGFYLDILKDRLYTCGKESLARRSSQTTLFQILEALIRWIAPILSFTAEEAWRLYHSDLESVHLSEWFEDWVCSSEGSISESEWQQVLKVRSEVNKIIESSRNSGLIGSALEAEIELFCSKDLESILRKFSEELRFVFITSEAKVLKENGEGEETAIEGLKIKINTVALKEINDNEILNLVNWCGENKFSLTFIEVMPMGEIGEKRSDQYMPLTEVKSLIQTKYSLTEDSLRTGGPARYVHCHETDQKIGFITPHTHNFCELCNRVRITCTGVMYMCLGQQDKADLKTPLRKSENDQLLKGVIYEAISRKPKGHDFVIERKENDLLVKVISLSRWFTNSRHKNN